MNLIEAIPGGMRTLAFAATFLGAAVAGLALIPLYRRLGVGQTVRDDGPATHLKKNGTPTMGGLIFILPAALALFALSMWDNRLLPPLLVTLAFGLVGFADDLIIVVKRRKDGLSPRQKSVGLLIAAAAFAFYQAFFVDGGMDILLPLTGMRSALTLPVWLYIPFTVFVFYATANAVNFTDGVDGLCSSVTLIVTTAFTVAAVVSVREDGAAALTAAFAGGCAGFLLFNAHPARVFMGDCGSLALGGAVAAAAVTMRVPWVILFFGLVYVAEALSVVIQVSYFKRTRRRIFKMAPLHHHFELSGWKENRIVAVFSLVTLAACGAGFLLLFGNILV